MNKCPKCKKSDEVVPRPDGTKYCLDCGERVAECPVQRIVRMSDATAYSLRPHDLLYNPTSGQLEWWSNSASCTIWQGMGKERKIAQCDDPGTAALICRLQWAAIKEANEQHKLPPPTA